MPLAYDNTGGATHSEAERAFAVAQDWTRSGAQTLQLYFYGDPANVAGRMYVKINGSRVDYDGDAQKMVDPSWTLWVVDLSSVGVDLEHIRSLGLGVDGAGSGILLIDDIRLYGEVDN